MSPRTITTAFNVNPANGPGTPGAGAINPADWVVSAETLNKAGQVIGQNGGFGPNGSFGANVSQTTGRLTLSNGQACPSSIRVPVSARGPGVGPPGRVLTNAIQECVDKLSRQRRTDHLGAETEHVHVVVLDSLVGAVGVVADRSADAAHLAGGHCGADAGAANKDTALALAALNSLAHLARLVGVVDADCIGVSPQIEDLVTGERQEYRLA